MRNFSVLDKLELENKTAGGLHVIKSKEEFFQGYSNPINRGIMRIYKDLDMVEHLGSGMNRILNFYKKEIFIFSDNFLRLVLKIDNSPIATPKKIPTKELLLQYMRGEPSITREQLSEKLNIGINGVKQHILSLKKRGILIRIGSGRSGYWKVIDAS